MKRVFWDFDDLLCLQRDASLVWLDADLIVGQSLTLCVPVASAVVTMDTYLTTQELLANSPCASPPSATQVFNLIKPAPAPVILTSTSITIQVLMSWLLRGFLGIGLGSLRGIWALWLFMVNRSPILKASPTRNLFLSNILYKFYQVESNPSLTSNNLVSSVQNVTCMCE